MFKHHFLFYLKLYAKKSKTFLLSQNALVFLFFLCLSFIFWYMQSMRKKYENDINVKIRYENVQSGIVNIDELPREMTATVREQGFNILFYKRRNPIEITLDFARFKQNADKSFTVSGDLLQNQLRNALMNSTQIMRISPNGFNIKSVKKIGIKVPLKFNGKVSFAQQYNQSDSIRVQPDTVEVYGDKHILDTLTCLYTEFVSFSNLKETTQRSVNIHHPKQITISPLTAEVIIPTERFTERMMNIPITGKNIPQGMNLRTFPPEVNVSFFINERRVSSVESISASIDYDDILKNKTGKIAPKIEAENPFIKNIQCHPKEVDFLLEYK